MRRLIAFIALCLVHPLVPLLAQVQITEFMANNTKTLRDSFGQYEDWIELYNNSATNVSLLDWSLTDDRGNLAKWRFPSTNLPPKAFLVVFASNRDLRVPGAPLHTNFKLDPAGEYLALARSDGTVATQFSPLYPPQFPDVSFGFSLKSAGDLLISADSVGRAFVPTDGSLGTNWTASNFDDAGWQYVTNGIGFETGASDDPATVRETVLADHPPGYWRLDTTTGTTIPNLGVLGSSGNGQLRANVVLGVSGPRPPVFPGFASNNAAARFDGAGARVEVPYSPELNPSGAFTVETWVKPARTGAGPAWVFSSLNVASGRSGYALAHDYSARAQWEFRLGDTGGYIAMPHGGVVNPDSWQYVAGVYDGSSARLYVDGVLAASSTLGRPFVPNASEVTMIGGRVDSANPYYYAGDVAEASVIARALSADEIAARFQTAIHPPISGTVFNYTALIHSDLRLRMLDVNSSVCLRLPFVITNLAELDQLTLRVRYDDGFVAFLNGVPVAASNAPASPSWDSSAISAHAVSEALQFEVFDLSDQRGLLKSGTNVLALQGLNVSATNTDFLLLAELEATALGDYAPEGRYFLIPTPRNVNGTGVKDLGPVLNSLEYTPSAPRTNDSITVTCHVEPAFAPVGQVNLSWRAMFGAVATLPMVDDGLHGDGAAGDGIFGATITNRQDGTYAAGQMLRWYVTASDSLSRTSRWPLFDNPVGSAQFLGTVVQPDYVTSPLPIFQFFAPPNVLQPGPNTQQIGADSEQGGRVALFFDGEFYDNIYMELRGNTSAGLNKKAHRLEFNRDHPFRHPGPGGRILKSSLLAEDLDPAYIRQHLCFWFLDRMGVPSPFDYPIRAQLNGKFYQLAFHTDVLGTEQLARLGYDPAGALYKCAGQVDPYFSSTGGFQKLLPKTNLNSRVDYLQLANGINERRSADTRRTNVFDLLDVAEVVNYLAGARFCAENDDVWANMCLYRDTYGDGLWRIVPFDMNASWGQLYGGSSPLQATNDFGKSHPFYGGSQVQENRSSAWNRIYDVIIALPETRDMLRRRERTLLDSWVLPPGTPPANLLLENYIMQMSNTLSAEAILDRQKWGFSPWAPSKSFASGIADLLKQFVGPRRSHWYITHCITNTAKPLGLGNNNNAGIPISQPADAVVSFTTWDFNPKSGNQDEEYLCLTNANSYAVDVSGWEVSGGIHHRFTPGTVIPPTNVLYLSPNVAAFRTRAIPPRGGMGLFVQGAYQGHLSARGEQLTLADSSGRIVSAATIEGAPSPAQQFLRITEIMYNPAPQPGSSIDPQSFEYLELKNISTNLTLNLAGCHLTNGIYFDFSTGAIQTLKPGETVLVVRDTNAFALRYGAGFNIAGQFFGALDNAGERLRLEDAAGENIQDFAYNNSWYPITDGLGFSLVIVDEQAPWSAWENKASWRASARWNGSPGTSDPDPVRPAPVLVNEILAHPVAPRLDSIELYNPTLTNVDLAGWWLTDDFHTPKKYRLPAGTTIGPKAYTVVSSEQFGPGALGFRLSSQGDGAYVFSSDATNLTGYYHGFDFEASPSAVSFGRYLTSQNEEQFVLESTATLGTLNAGPRVGPVVLTEIMYRPVDLTNGLDNSADEFIELLNISSTTVPLSCTFTNEPGYGLRAATNTWHLRHAVDYAFPTNTVLPAGQRLLVVGFDPGDSERAAAFRARYDLPAAVPLFGPWTGKLNNSADTIELESPDQPEVTLPDIKVPYIRVETVAYRDQAPWPTGADGLGSSLQRRNQLAYGNDPVNWFAALPRPGRDKTAPLSILTPPQDHTVDAGSDVTFAVIADGPPALRYAWQLNGTTITGATAATYSVLKAQPADAGDYGVVVTDGAGNRVSSQARLTVIVPALSITQISFDSASPGFSIPSWRGLNYVLEYKDDLAASSWTPLLPAVPGTGELLVLHDLTGPAAMRFYRIRTE